MKSIELFFSPVQQDNQTLQAGALEGPTHIAVSIRYSDGKLGVNQRGYYIEARPQIVKGGFVTMVAGRSKAHALHIELIEEATRFSKVKLQKLAACKNIIDKAQSLYRDTLALNGLVPRPEEKAA